MIVICAWCQKEGKIEVLKRTLDDLEDRISHGICHDHGLSLRQSLQRTRQYRPVVSPSPAYSV